MTLSIMILPTQKTTSAAITVQKCHEKITASKNVVTPVLTETLVAKESAYPEAEDNVDEGCEHQSTSSDSIVSAGTH